MAAVVLGSRRRRTTSTRTSRSQAARPQDHGPPVSSAGPEAGGPGQAPTAGESQLFASTQLSEPSAARARVPTPVPSQTIDAGPDQQPRVDTLIDGSDLWNDGSESATFTDAEPAPAVTPIASDQAPAPTSMSEPASKPARSGSFSAFATGATETNPDLAQAVDSVDLGPGLLDSAATSETSLRNRAELDRKALQSQFATARYELSLAHEQDVAHRDAEHERQVAGMRQEISVLRKQMRSSAAQLKQQSGNDQHRVGDLQAQVDIAEEEADTLRTQLEKERIANARKLTEERGAADRSLDNARREFREELDRHTRIHRTALSDHRDELDRTLAQARIEHADELESQHAEYEAAVEAERARRDAEIDALTRRHQQEIRDAEQHDQAGLARQAAQYKETITSLRKGQSAADAEIVELQRVGQKFRNEIAALRKQQRQEDGQHSSTVQSLQDELALTRTELTAERERSKALREDVLKRSAASHELVDKALEERNAQLAELDAAVARQRDYADARVREIQAQAEERAREAATREADMTATISRLKHEVQRLQDD